MDESFLRGGFGFGVSLSKPCIGTAGSHGGYFTIGGNGRHDRGHALRQIERDARVGHMQRRGINNQSRGARHFVDALRAGNWGGINEGLYRAADRAVPSCPLRFPD